MRVIEKTKATSSLAAYTTGVKKDPVVVIHKGKPIAALVSIDNADLETVSLSTNKKFLALIERSRVRQQREGGISSNEMRQRLGMLKTE